MSLTRSLDGSALVTGAQGFIGSWLAERLVDDGVRVVAPLRAAREVSYFRKAGLDERCELVEVDLLDVMSVSRALNECGVETVFHLAAATIAGDVVRNPLAAFDVNARGTYNLLEACRSMRASGLDVRVVAASSYHAYGDHGGVPYQEHFALRPSHPYGVSKACADVIARSYAATYDMPVAVTRLANVYGGGDMEFSRLVPDAARALVGGDRPVIRSDGTPERDFVYVEDAVRAYLAVAESLEHRPLWGRAWNAGSGEPVAIADLIGRLIAAAGGHRGPDVRLRHEPGAAVDRQPLDSTAIGEELGWRAEWGLEEGLAATYGWYEDNLR